MSETHEIVSYSQKPSDDEIIRLITEYFDEQANEYDQLSKGCEKRKIYIDRIDQIITSELQRLHKSSLKILSIGCGTGIRENKIGSQLTQSIG